jgi:SulP family sulfate permease
LIIFSSEVKDFLGLGMGAVPGDFLGKWRAVGSHLHSVNLWAVGIAVATVTIIELWPRLGRRIPGPFVALVATTAVAYAFHLPVETVGTRFGVIDASLPAPALPAVTTARLVALIGPAFTIALLGGIESLLSAVVSDGMIGGRHRSTWRWWPRGSRTSCPPCSAASRRRARSPARRRT